MLILVLGVVCIGFAPIFVKLIGIGPTAIALYRCALGCVIFVPICLFQPRSKKKSPPPRLDRKFWWLAAGAGLFFALDLTVWHRSLIYVGAGMGTLLANTQIFYTAMLGVLFLKEGVTLRLLLAIAIAFAGIVLLTGFHGEVADLSRYWIGIGFGLLTGLFYALFLLCLRKAETYSMHLTSSQRFAVVTLFSTAVLVFFALGEGDLVVPSARDWGWLCLLALVAQVVGWSLIGHQLPKVAITRAGLVLLLQPVVAGVMGRILFDEKITSMQAIGVLLTLTGVYLGTTRTVEFCR